MSQNFKLKYDQMRDSNPTKPEAEPDHHLKEVEQFYPEEGKTRHICFVWRDGKRKFMNYSYLVSGDYLPDESIITLTFTTETFILKGVNLEVLFYDIMQQWVRQVTCVDQRYNVVGEDQKFVVNEIEITKNN